DSKFYDQVKGTFGDDRVIVVALTTQDVFTFQFVKKLARLTSDLEAVRGVEEAQSITNVKSIRRIGGDVVVDKLIPGNATQEELKTIRGSVVADPLYLKNYISEDGRTAGINVFLKQMDESETRRVAREISHIARSEAGGDDLILAGV